MESDDSPPPLNNSLTIPSQPLLDHQNHWSLSPEYSRAQAITRGQWELVEMVKNMPESSYELSFKDLVEHPKIETESQTNQEGERLAANSKQILHQRGVLMNVKRVHQERKKNDYNVIKSGGLKIKGMFLNIVFPLPLKSMKKKNSASNTSEGFLSRTEEGIKGGGERDWWKKKFNGSSDRDCSRTSTNTRSSSTTITISSGGSSSGRSYSVTRYLEHLYYFQSFKIKNS